MRGIGGEPVEVWMSSGRPARFVWRGRTYTVLIVLDRRYEPRGAAVCQPAEASSVRSAEDRDCWLVEATPQRNVPTSTYELCHELDADRWLLLRAEPRPPQRS
ncbi:MAG TPA: DUF6504 family protein [Streptosporangiaceae bacterium]|jgi:hypothetical protein